MYKLENKGDLLTHINLFLQNRVKNVDTGWTPVSEEDYMLLEQIIQALIDLKWEKDIDGDHTMRYALCDRSKEEWLWPLVIPYKHSMNKVRLLAAGINAATDKLYSEINILEDIEKEKE